MSVQFWGWSKFFSRHLLKLRLLQRYFDISSWAFAKWNEENEMSFDPALSKICVNITANFKSYRKWNKIKFKEKFRCGRGFVLLVVRLLQRLHSFVYGMLHRSIAYFPLWFTDLWPKQGQTIEIIAGSAVTSELQKSLCMKYAHAGLCNLCIMCAIPWQWIQLVLVFFRKR